MKAATLTLRIRLAWWVLPYIRTCAFFAALTGLEPDADKIVRNACRGVHFEVA